ncbi:hypothetical protein TNCT_56711 [Trichonephila clavata]|uniref:Uncharacterized protein n=1 Tax=Trichonephila clavata TaxID=2740835 RepID=A0A8X6LX75_TRICU|nr:hypothetical protein TNCT_56711 [Trichonephila clavata]
MKRIQTILQIKDNSTRKIEYVNTFLTNAQRLKRTERVSSDACIKIRDLALIVVRDQVTSCFLIHDFGILRDEITFPASIFIAFAVCLSVDGSRKGWTPNVHRKTTVAD